MPKGETGNRGEGGLRAEDRRHPGEMHFAVTSSISLGREGGRAGRGKRRNGEREDGGQNTE